MWTSSCNTKAQPKQKSIAARATLSGFGTNLAYNRNKLETTKFIVTLKPIRKQHGEEGSKSPTTSKECCRCEGKVIKAHEKIQVKADDLLKGKTILNAFRLLANSKFITIDKNYEPTNAKILLPTTTLTQHSTERTEQKNDLKTIENKSNHSKKLETKEHIHFTTRTPVKSSSDKSNQANLCSDSNLENLKKMIIDRIRKSQEIKIRDDMRKRDSQLKSCEENQKVEKSEDGNQQNNNNQIQNQGQRKNESLDQQSPEPSQNKSQDPCQEENQNKIPTTNQNLKVNQSQKQKTQSNPKEYLTKPPNLKRNRNQIRSQSESPNPSSNRYAREQNSRNLSQGHHLCANSYTIAKTVTSPSLNQYKTPNQSQNLDQNQSPNQNLKLKLNKQSKNQPQNQTENQLKMKNPNLNSSFDLKLNSKSFVSTNQTELNINQEQIQNKAQSQQATQDITLKQNPISSLNHNSSPTIKPIIKPFPYLTKSKNQYPYQNKNLSQTPMKSPNQNQQNPKQNPNRNRNQNQNRIQNQNPCENFRHNLNKYQTQENQNQNKNQTHKNHQTQNQYETLKENKILREKQNQIENQNQDRNKNQTPIQYENKEEYPNQCENQTQSPYANQEEYHSQVQNQYVSQNQYQSQDLNQFSKIQSQERIVPNTRMNDDLTYDITPTGGNSSENHSPDDGATDDDNGDGDGDGGGGGDGDADADGDGNDKDNDAAEDDDDKDRLTGGNDNKRSRSPRDSTYRRSSLRDSISSSRRDSFRSAQEDLPAPYPRPVPMTARRECLLNLRGYTVSPVREPAPLPREEKKKKKRGARDDIDEEDEKDEKDGRNGKNGKDKSKKGWFRQKKKDEPSKSSTATNRRRESVLESSVSQDPYSSKRVIFGERCCDRSCAYRKAISRQQAFAKQYGNLGCDRIGLLENQLEQLRMELSGIRTDVMPNGGENPRFSALDKRLLELNFLINDMKQNCGGELSRLPQPSQYPLTFATSSLTPEPIVEQQTAPPPQYVRRSLTPEPRVEQPPAPPPRLQNRRREEITPVARDSYSAPGKRGKRGSREKEEEPEEELESIESVDSVVVQPDLTPEPFKCEVCDCNSDIDAARKLANCIFIRTKKCTCDNCDCEKYDKIKRDACMLLPDDLPEEEEGEEEYDEEELAMIAEQEALQEICRKSGIEAGLAAAQCNCGVDREKPSRKDCETETTNTEDKDTCTEDAPIDTAHGENDYYGSYRSSSYDRNSGSYGRARDEPTLGQSNSFCRYCNNSNYPIIDNNDLCVEVMRRLGQYCVNEIALTILLQSNGLYHINIAVISSGEHIACLYATELAIRCANQTNFFEDIMTFFIVDAKNTHSQKNQILKHTFEFVDDDRK